MWRESKKRNMKKERNYALFEMPLRKGKNEY